MSIVLLGPVTALTCTAFFRTLCVMSSTLESQKNARLDLRLPSDARALIVEAASLSGVSLTDYVLNIVVPAARHDVIEARTIRLSKQGWDDFLDILDRPDSTALAELREHRPNWHERRQ